MLIKYRLLKVCIPRQASDYIWICLKFVFKASGKLLFSLFIINQDCTPKMFYFKKFMFKVSERLLFSQFIIDQYCIKKVCSKRVGGCFLVYSSLISIVSRKFFTWNFIKVLRRDAF